MKPGDHDRCSQPGGAALEQCPMPRPRGLRQAQTITSYNRTSPPTRLQGRNEVDVVRVSANIDVAGRHSRETDLAPVRETPGLSPEPISTRSRFVSIANLLLPSRVMDRSSTAYDGCGPAKLLPPEAHDNVRSTHVVVL